MKSLCFSVMGRGKSALWGFIVPTGAARLNMVILKSAVFAVLIMAGFSTSRGNCLEQPAESQDSQFHKKVKHLSYPVRELGGLIFAYMGPDRDEPPPFPRYSPLAIDGGQRYIEPIDTTTTIGSTLSKMA